MKRSEYCGIVYDMRRFFTVSSEEMATIREDCKDYEIPGKNYIGVFSYEVKGRSSLFDALLTERVKIDLRGIKKCGRAYLPVEMPETANNFLFAGIVRPLKATEADVKLYNLKKHSEGLTPRSGGTSR